MKPERLAKLQECLEDLQSVFDALDEVKEDEECAYDNLPEAMQDGERGDQMQENIDNLDDANSVIEEAISTLEEAVSAAENEDLLEVEPWEKLEKGDFVMHKSFGQGIITGIDGKFITVEFPEKTSKFIAQDAFSKGFLTLQND